MKDKFILQIDKLCLSKIKILTVIFNPPNKVFVWINSNAFPIVFLNKRYFINYLLIFEQEFHLLRLDLQRLM